MCAMQLNAIVASFLEELCCMRELVNYSCNLGIGRCVRFRGYHSYYVA